MFTSETTDDPPVWLIADVVYYPNLYDFEETCYQAHKQGLAVPVAGKWKSVQDRLPFLIPVRAWLD